LLLPSVRATWAPKGKTPVLSHRFSWKRLSMAGALVYEPDGSNAELVFKMRPGAYNDDSLIEFLIGLHELLGERKVTLIWDGLPSHRSKKMQGYLQTASLAARRTPTRLCPRAQSHRGAVGEPEGERPRQPLSRKRRGAGASCRQRPLSHRQRPRAVPRLHAADSATAVTPLRAIFREPL
jgi:DDE superfamily endonuclease